MTWLPPDKPQDEGIAHLIRTGVLPPGRQRNPNSPPLQGRP